MIRAENSNSDAETINVMVGRFGSEPSSHEVREGSTVQDVLESAGIALGGTEKVWVNEEKAAMADIPEDGDEVVVVTPKQAGNR